MGQTLRRNAGTGRAGWRTAEVVAALLIAAVPLRAQDLPHRFTSGRLTVAAHARDTALARSLLTRSIATDSFPSLPRPVENVFISIAPDEAAFRALIGEGAPEWGVAFALPLERRVVMQGRRAPSAAGNPIQVLRHELAHLALHEHLGSLPPRWFTEGYASWAAGEWGREDMIAANVGLALNGFRTLASLDSGFALGASRAQASYALAHRAVAELDELAPRRGLPLLFRYWRESRSFEVGLRQAYGLTLAGFEQRWRERTRRRYGALALFADVTLATLLFLALIAPFYWLRRKRDRLRRRALEVADREAEERERDAVIAQLLAGLVRPPDQTNPTDGNSS